MANYAVVKDGVVENIIVWDGVAEFSVEGSELIEATADARIGGSWDGKVFTFVEPPAPEPTPEQLAHEAARQSALNKLFALGLSSEEIIALLRG